jgi:uncharacterized membrane protein YhaH (DUF805 family)
MVAAVKSVLGQYANFSGRARRSEFWMFYLAFFLVLMIVGLVIGIPVTIAASGSDSAGPIMILPILMGLIGLASIIPILAVIVRRLHDQGKPGYWYFVTFIPMVGAIWLLVLLCTDGTPGPNQYGADPKGRMGYAPPQMYGQPGYPPPASPQPPYGQQP